MQKKWVRGALFASAAAVLATALHLGATPAARAAEPYKAPRTAIHDTRIVPLDGRPHGHVPLWRGDTIHDTRIVPLDGRPHGHVPLWRGDSRGHWEGDTLVVDTINFKRETSFPNSGANLHLVEKFTRTDADTLMYEFTIDDPSVWTRPFTAVV